MDLDQMKQQWEDQNRKLDETLRLNRQLLKAWHLNAGRSRLQRLRAATATHALGWLACAIGLGDFLYRHAASTHLAIAGAVLDVYAAAMLIALINQLARIARIDYQQPVTVIQKQLEATRILRIRSTQWGVLAGAVVWAPALIVVAQAVAGVDVYRLFGPAWVVANVLFGLALIPLSLWIAKRFAGRMEGSPFVQGMLNDLGGKSLIEAIAFLAMVSDFEGT